MAQSRSHKVVTEYGELKWGDLAAFVTAAMEWKNQRDDAARITFLPRIASSRNLFLSRHVLEGLYFGEQGKWSSVAAAGLKTQFMTIHDLKASEAKDKAYAFLWEIQLSPIAHKHRQHKFFDLDYKKSLVQVYTEFTTAIIQVLCDTYPLYMAGQQERLASLPSWVPDWSTAGANSTNDSGLSTTQQILTRGEFLAGAPCSPEFAFDFEDANLIAYGSIITNVTASFGLPSIDDGTNSSLLDSSFDAFKDIFRELSSLVKSGRVQKMVGYESLTAILFQLWKGKDPATLAEARSAQVLGIDYLTLRTAVFGDLCCAFTESMSAIAGQGVDVEVWLSKINPILEPHVSPAKRHEAFNSCRRLAPANSLLFWTLADAIESDVNLKNIIHAPTGDPWVRGKKIFFTENGMVGAAIKVKPDDKIALWKGMQCPLVLRKPEGVDEDNTWALASPAYIHGLMLGESYREDELVRLTIV
jgi:hypothetical protein